VLNRDLARMLDPVLFARDAGIVCDEWQARLLREQPRRCLMCCSRQSGKSTCVGLMASHVAIYEPGSLVVLAAPSMRQSGELLRTIKLMHAKLDDVPEMVNDSVLRVELANGSRIIALPGEQKTVRGLSAARMIIADEAAQIDDDLMGALRPMLAVNRSGALILLSTPKGKRGTFYELWHNGDAAWTRVRVPASECLRISKEFLAEELRELGAARFSEEYELAFIDSDTSAFSTSIIDAAFSSEILPLW
jgi:hypothetical protein